MRDDTLWGILRTDNAVEIRMNSKDRHLLFRYLVYFS